MNLRSLAFTLILSLSLGIAFGQVDYRYYQSPVKHQQGRGTCTAFAVCGLLETFSGVPSDLSEQSLYANVKSKVFAETGKIYGGEFLKEYPFVLETSGVFHEEFVPYEPNAVVWKEGPEWQQKLISEMGGMSLMDLLKLHGTWRRYGVPKGGWNHLPGPEAKDVDKIKQVLEMGTKAVAVGYGVHKPTWKETSGTAEDRFSFGQVAQIRNGDKVMGWTVAKLAYSDFDEKLANGELQLELIDPDTNNWAGHAVLIVGYTDKGFIIKNSWGTGWGDKGYAFVGFEYHMAFCNEALYIHLAEAVDAFAGDPDPHADIRLKTLPETFLGKKMVQLSIFSNSEGKLPKFTSIEYKLVPENAVFPVNKDAKALITEIGATSGFPVIVEVPTEHFRYTVTMKYRVEGNAFEQTKVFKDVGWINAEYQAE